METRRPILGGGAAGQQRNDEMTYTNYKLHAALLYLNTALLLTTLNGLQPPTLKSQNLCKKQYIILYERTNECNNNKKKIRSNKKSLQSSNKKQEAHSTLGITLGALFKFQRLYLI